MTRAELIEALETAQGADSTLDFAIVEWLYKERISLAPLYPGPINYDPRLWQERYGFSPTGSIDAAMMLASHDMDDADIGVMLNEAAFKCILAGSSIRTDLPRFIAAACLRAGGE